MGVSIREKKPGEWWVFITHRGRRKSKKVGRDKQEAEKVAAKIEARLTLGDMGLLKEEKKIKTFGEYAGMWIDGEMPAKCKIGTVEIYKAILKNHILPVFKNRPVTEINRLMVRNFFVEKMNGGLSLTTVGNMKNVISGVLNMAVDDEVLAVNPAQRLGRFWQKELKRECNPLNRKETALLLETFKRHYPQHYPFVLTLARTGMRIGEAAALQWGDIDFNSRFITVQRTLSDKGYVDVPKNNCSRRVDMSRQLTQTLLQLKRQRIEEKLKYGWKELPEWVFMSSRNKRITMCNWREWIFNKALEKAGLRKIRVHDLRHGYAHQLIRAGEPLIYIRDQLGHHSIKITADIYGNIKRDEIGDNKRIAVDCLDDAPFSTLSAPRVETVEASN